ncbi:MAG: bifunctional 4'-phosphopantothenoylcysteine decarboxylase/phosphopantothenoylcysteine synthetase, partial [Acidobacteria bacterium]|nr:bifunctional 4'-phosphopantothenoylcysteine decarboxylase/phosphopantothenoylcysteine synthetase [Acidobacteriota bacterium]
REMHVSVLACAEGADAVVRAAAVADYAPAEGVRPGKIRTGPGALTVRFERTPDILAELGRRRAGAARPVLVGFAAETQDLVQRAREKLREKQVDLVVANDVSLADRGFAADTNAATLVTADGEEDVPLGTKRALAAVLLDRMETLVHAPVAS